MKQQRERPARRNNRQQPGQDKEQSFPFSAREFMKLSLSGLLSTSIPIRVTRLMPPERAA